jgi:UDP-2,3-diacylglucosamine pyrophosphatase LpxH
VRARLSSRAVRTLIISDLHLGNHSGHDVLRRPAAQERLWAALSGVDRLVLLGDTVELMNRRSQVAMAIAEPIMRELGRRMTGREIVIVPGNHDAPLVRSWALQKGRALGASAAVPPDATPALSRLVEWLTPAAVRVNYPGVWLRAGVWATHGHYLDRHLMPTSAVGLLRPRDPRRPLRLASPADYERARGRRRAHRPLTERFLQRPLGTLVEEFIGLARPALGPRVALMPRLAMDAGLAPLTAALLDLQMRHAATPALARVLERLAIDAEWIVFGHVHRRGPIDGERWRSSRAGQAVNTGSWLYEPLLLDRARPPHPYWPGGAVLVQNEDAPRTLGLLDDLTELARR